MAHRTNNHVTKRDVDIALAWMAGTMRTGAAQKHWKLASVHTTIYRMGILARHAYRQGLLSHTLGAERK